MSYLNHLDSTLLKRFLIKSRQIHRRQPDTGKIIAQLADAGVTSLTDPAPKLIRFVTMVQNQSLV